MSLIKFNNQRLFPSWSDLLDSDKLISSRIFDGSSPATNIEDTDAAYIIKMALPGVKKDDVKVSLEGNLLVVSSEVENTEEEKNKKYSRKEYSYSAFNRSFSLPENVDVNTINANFENGELILSLPKKVNSVVEPKRIEVA